MHSLRGAIGGARRGCSVLITACCVGRCALVAHLSWTVVIGINRIETAIYRSIQLAHALINLIAELRHTARDLLIHDIEAAIDLTCDGGCDRGGVNPKSDLGAGWVQCRAQGEASEPCGHAPAHSRRQAMILSYLSLPYLRITHKGTIAEVAGSTETANAPFARHP